jgi:hypothetical protein
MGSSGEYLCVGLVPKGFMSQLLKSRLSGNWPFRPIFGFVGPSQVEIPSYRKARLSGPIRQLPVLPTNGE